MTEAEWLACTDPTPMLEFLRGKASDRKLRLFACACCRRMWASLKPERTRRAVETAERYADGQASEPELARAQSMACDAAHAAVRQGSRWRSGHAGRGVESRLFFAADAAHPHRPFLIGRLQLPRRDEELKSVSPALLRDLLGPLPFRPVALALAWRSADVVHLAQAAYEHRDLPAGTQDPARLAVLADALEEAGCDQPDLLAHLRGPGPHVLGCWVIDLLLGKE